MLLLNRVQDFLPSASEEFEINGQFSINHFDQRQPTFKPFPRALDFEPHESAKFPRIVFVRDIGFGYAVNAEIFERQINSSLFVIEADVLPEVRKLKGSAGEI